jgi:hypothetical protein
MSSDQADGSADERTAVTPAADWAVAIATGLLGLLGLFIAGWARDGLFELFGWSLLVFGLAFCFGVVRAHYDRLDRAILAAAKAGGRS